VAAPSSFEPRLGRAIDRPGDSAVEQAVAGAARTQRVLTAALVLAGAWVLIRHPVVRRVAWRLGRQAVGLGAAALVRQVHRSWHDTAPQPDGDAT
jgi:hypothetical protein